MHMCVQNMNKINFRIGKKRTSMLSAIRKKNHVNRFLLVHRSIQMITVS
jgi:hypothetical protein